MNTEPQRNSFERIVLRPIENGYLIEVETEDRDLCTAAPSWRQVIKYLKTLSPAQEE